MTNREVTPSEKVYPHSTELRESLIGKFNLPRRDVLAGSVILDFPDITEDRPLPTEKVVAAVREFYRARGYVDTSDKVSPGVPVPASYRFEKPEVGSALVSIPSRSPETPAGRLELSVIYVSVLRKT